MMKSILFVGFLAVISHHVYRIANLMGIHKHVYNHQPGPCKVVPGIVNGSEDIFVLPNGLAFISSGIDICHIAHDLDTDVHGFTGRIFLFDFNQPDQAAKVIPVDGFLNLSTFRPHGIDVWRDKKTEKVSLFVVNHGGNEDSIEVFDFDQEKTVLKHRKTIRDKLMLSVNDLVTTGPESFYFTNDGYNYGGIKRFLENLFLRSWGTVVYYDGTECRIVLHNGQMYNGINMSPDGSLLYVNEVHLNTMVVLKRESNNTLSLIQSVALESACDNIFVDESGDIWQGCHPILYKFQFHATNMSNPTPTQVLHLKAVGSKGLVRDYEIREVLSNDGSLVKGSSVAAYYRGSLLIGTVMDKMAYCEVKAF